MEQQFCQSCGMPLTDETEGQMPMGAVVRIIACIVTKKVSLPKISQ